MGEEAVAPDVGSIEEQKMRRRFARTFGGCDLSTATDTRDSQQGRRELYQKATHDPPQQVTSAVFLLVCNLQ
ncbi:MAG: hypothetical protein WDO17_18650 [Alphaproteobacteria bacterium]